MQKSRTRQFNMTRDKNLSQTFSQISRPSNCDQSLYRETIFNQSLTSAFNKKSKVPVCNNCVNKKLIEEKKEVFTKQKQKELLETQRKRAQLQKYRDSAQELRSQFAKEAEAYNKKVAQRHLISVQSAKQLDTVYMRQICQRQKQEQELIIKLQSMRKEKQQSYRKQLKEQYDVETTNKLLEKQSKRKEQPDKPLIKGYSSRHLRLKYAEELKKQIQKQKRRKQQSKLLEKKVDKMAVSYAQQKFLDYSEFKTPRNAQINPQIFEEIKEIEQKRKQQILQQRISKQLARKQQQMKNKQDMIRVAKQALKNTKSYASVLEKQMSEKQHKKEYQREISKRFKEEPPFVFTQESTSVKQACGQCQSHVEERALSYY